MILTAVLLGLSLLEIFEFTVNGFVSAVVNGLIYGYIFVVLYSLSDKFEHEAHTSYAVDYQAIDRMNMQPITPLPMLQMPPMAMQPVSQYPTLTMGQYQTEPVGQYQMPGPSMTQMTMQPMPPPPMYQTIVSKAPIDNV